MGVVYRAHDARIKRDVALKIMRWTSATPEQVARFSREAHAAGSLNHPNIIAVYDVGTENGMPFVVTELLDGETLRDKLRPGLLPFRRAVEIGVQIANALDAAHRKNIWHRDVKPANVFITNDWRAKLLDFGIAKLSEPDPKIQGDIDTASQTAGFHGTPGYMSPEQVRGEPVDHRTDIFALGTVLYEMFTGKRAFQRETPLETMNAVVHAEPADPLTLNPSLSLVAAAVVRRCLEKNKEDRFQTARDLAFQLQQLNELKTGAAAGAGSSGSACYHGVGVTVPAVATSSGRRGDRARVVAAQPAGARRLSGSRSAVAGSAARDSPPVAWAWSTAWRARATNSSVARIDDLADSPTSRSLKFESGTDILAVHAGELAVMLNPRFLQARALRRYAGRRPNGQHARQQARQHRRRGLDARPASWPSFNPAGKIGEDSQIEFPQGTMSCTRRRIPSASCACHQTVSRSRSSRPQAWPPRYRAGSSRSSIGTGK